MDPRKYESGAAATPPVAPEEFSTGYPSAGNPSTGTQATKPGSFWFYQIGESLRNLITGAGLTPDAEDLTLIYQSVAQMIADANTALPIGSVFPIWDHLPGSQKPSNAGTAKYIKLTAGEDGVGGFNFGLLTGESITGAAPLLVATAEIAIGPMAGGTIHLVNSMQAHITPGESSGTYHTDVMQQITGSFSGGRDSTATQSGAFTRIGVYGAGYGGSSAEGRTYLLDSADSPNARTSNKTDTKRVEATYYMRIA